MTRVSWPRTPLPWSALREGVPALLIAIVLAPCVSRGMEIEWTRMAGQWPVEASPLVADFSHNGKVEILVLNRGGQIMLWSPEGTAVGSGQDGLVAQLTAGRWTTAQTPIDAPQTTHLLVSSVEGLVVALDTKFQVLWQHKLPGETAWGNATPAPLTTSAGLVFAFGDSSGTVTCLTDEGRIVWTNALGAGPIKAAPSQLPGDQKEQ